MIARKIKKVVSISALIILLVLITPRLCYWVSWQIYMINPNVLHQTKASYEHLPSEVLVKKLGVQNVWFDIALDVLAKRKDREAVPFILPLLKSPFKYRRHSAIRALADIGDERAEQPLMKILKRGDQHPDYSEALHALSKMKYEPAYIYVSEWAHRSDAPRNGSVYMLKDFGKKESIPLLENIREQVKSDEPVFVEEIDEEIKIIKSKQVEIVDRN